jgi:hypothetical protein
VKNVFGVDRFLRALIGVLALELAYFWLTGPVQVVAYGVGVVMLVTSLVGFCPIYAVLGWGKVRNGAMAPRGKPVWVVLALLAIVATAAAGSYASQLFSRKFFLEDFNAMNNFYKQTLFLTGKGEREKAVTNYDQLLVAYSGFQSRYMAWQPVVLRSDEQFPGDLGQVAGILQGVNDLVRAGDLQKAHLALEGVRPVFQDLFKRNGFSMLSVTLVDFHDAMELMLEAGIAKDAAKLQSLYPQVDAKMKAVEAEAGDADILAIRANLDALLKAAQQGDADALPKRADQLKSSFVKVYLQRG